MSMGGLYAVREGIKCHEQEQRDVSARPKATLAPVYGSQQQQPPALGSRGGVQAVSRAEDGGGFGIWERAGWRRSDRRPALAWLLRLLAAVPARSHFKVQGQPAAKAQRLRASARVVAGCCA